DERQPRWCVATEGIETPECTAGAEHELPSVRQPCGFPCAERCRQTYGLPVWLEAFTERDAVELPGERSGVAPEDQRAAVRRNCRIGIQPCARRMGQLPALTRIQKDGEHCVGRAVASGIGCQHALGVGAPRNRWRAEERQAWLDLSDCPLGSAERRNQPHFT